MTTFEIAKDHFTKTDNSLFVKVNGNDYELTKNWFGAWARGEDRIILFKCGNRTYKYILTKNIRISK